MLNRSDVDTDQIIPKQFLKRVERTGFGQYLFYDWAKEPGWDLDPNEILVTGRNFGCGSSREHAPWALQDYGFKALVAPSFADIFYSNCTKIGMLPVPLPEEEVEALMAAEEAEIDLEDEVVRFSGREVPFEAQGLRQAEARRGPWTLRCPREHVLAYRSEEPDGVSEAAVRATVARWLAQRRPGTVLSLVLFGFGLPMYLFTVNRLNTPEQWPIFSGGALILGLAVGRGWALLGGVAIIPALWSTGPGAGEGNSYLVLVFLPLAFVSIAAGVLVHRGIARLIARRTERTSRVKTCWDLLLGGGQEPVQRSE